MADAHRSESDRELGPIDFVAVEFPDGKVSASGFETLLDLADRGVIEILDLEFIVKGPDGDVSTVPVSDLDVSGEVDLMVGTGLRQECSTTLMSPRSARLCSPVASQWWPSLRIAGS